MTDFDKRLNVAWWALKIAPGVGPVVAGIASIEIAMEDNHSQEKVMNLEPI